MKKIVLLVALCLCVGNLFAQDADKLRDEGDAALKAKDYATVVTKYGEYGSPDKPGGLSIQLCKSEKKEFYIRYSS